MSVEIEVIKMGRKIEYTSRTGIKTTLYNIGTFAKEINRSTVTVRRWEYQKILPKTPFKLNNKRLYAREHVEAVKRILEEEYPYNCVYRIDETNFTPRCFQAFQEIHQQFFGS